MPRVVVDVMLKPEILDPQGQAVANALPRLGVDDVTSVRIGRRIELEFAGEPDLDRARVIADKLLANPVIEDFEVWLAADPDTPENARPAGTDSPATATATDATAAGATAGPAGDSAGTAATTDEVRATGTDGPADPGADAGVEDGTAGRRSAGQDGSEAVK